MSPITPMMKKMGFVESKDIKITHRIIMSVSGLEKQGKTHFSLTAPDPIVMFSTDIGEEGVIHKFDKDIMVMRLNVEDPDEAADEWDKYIKAYHMAMDSDKVRTIVVDTATEIWELVRLAEFGRLTQVMPYQYGPVNAKYRAMIRAAYSSDKNLILLHKMKPRYVNDKRVEGYDRAGFSDTGFLVQVNAEVMRDEEDGEFGMMVNDCRQNPDLAGEYLGGPMCSFPFLASMIFPDTSPDDWE